MQEVFERFDSAHHRVTVTLRDVRLCPFSGRGVHSFIMKSIFVTALALLQTIELSSASPESLLYPPSHRSLHARRLEVSRDSDSTRVLSALKAREDYTCGPGSELLLQPCSSTMLVHQARSKSQRLAMAVHQENPPRRLTAPEARRHFVVKWVYSVTPSASATGPMECKFSSMRPLAVWFFERWLIP